MLTPQKIFYSALSAARALRMSARTFRRLAEESGVEPVEIGRNHFWMAKDLPLIQEYWTLVKANRTWQARRYRKSA